MFLLLLLSVLLAFYLQETIYRKYWNKNLQVKTVFTDAHVYEGDTSYLREEISNDKKLPLPALEVRLAISRSLEFAHEAKVNTNVTDLSYKRDVFSFLFHQKVIHTLPFICKKRGFYQISTVEVVGYDLFFSAKHYLNAAQQTQLYVYPAQTDTRRIQLICQAITGMVLVQNRLYPDPFEFSGIREYRMDPMHHINWKASAKSSTLMVNQFDSTTRIDATILLDVEDSRILRYESLTEECIRICSSLAARLVKNNVELHLVSNAVIGRSADLMPGGDAERGTNTKSGGDGYGTDLSLSWSAKPGAGRIQELNRKLACIDTQQRAENINVLLKKETAKRLSGQIYVLLSKNQESVSMELLRALAAGNKILWVIPVRPGEALLHAEVPNIRIMKWEVGVS